jgi:enterobacterial common antigen flippase
VEIALLAVIILVSNINGGQMAVVQGLRRIGDLARIQLAAGLAGTVISIALYGAFGLQGIIPSLILVAFSQLAIAWHFVRRVSLMQVRMSWNQTFSSASELVQLGLVFMLTTLINTVVYYVTRALITQQYGLDALGIFTAAFALSGMFVSFILNAMAADYYPRLTAAATNRNQVNRLVNEQVEVGMLLAVPGLLLTLSLAPWIIRIFYTQEFLPAGDLLQWFILGCVGRVLSWPLEYIMLALGQGTWYFYTMLLFNVLHLLLNIVALQWFGIEGVAQAFSVLYLVSTLIIYFISRRLTGFYWSREVVRLLFLLLPIVFITFIVVRALPMWPSTLFGLLVSAGASIFALRGLVKRIGYGHRLVQKICRFPGVRWVSGA